jgi:hypothetical protein
MESVNTRLFTVEELSFKKYANLMETLQIMIDSSCELEWALEEIEEIEQEQGFLGSEMLSEMNYITTQLDYVYKNIDVIISAMKYQESKSFFKVRDLPLFCLN